MKGLWEVLAKIAIVDRRVAAKMQMLQDIGDEMSVADFYRAVVEENERRMKVMEKVGRVLELACRDIMAIYDEDENSRNTFF